jgi:4-oxalocrotonate tautomerase
MTTLTLDDIMPHLSIKHFPTALSVESKAALVATLTQAVRQAFGCPENVISIALEPVDPEAWHSQVYDPEILQKSALLCKQPNY